MSSDITLSEEQLTRLMEGEELEVSRLGTKIKISGDCSVVGEHDWVWGNNSYRNKEDGAKLSRRCSVCNETQSVELGKEELFQLFEE